MKIEEIAAKCAKRPFYAFPLLNLRSSTTPETVAFTIPWYLEVWKTMNHLIYILFLSAMSLRRTSKDLNFLSFLPPSLFIETKFWQKPKSWHRSQCLSQSKNLISKNTKKIIDNSEGIPKILKISISLHSTKNLLGLFQQNFA